MLFKPVIVDETVEKSKVIVVLTPGIPKKR
jgi:hypothetical protein